MRRQNSWTDPTIIGEHRGTLWFHRPEINSISGNVVIRPFPSHASKFPPRRLTTWLASPGLIRTRPLHPIERNWLHASHPLTIGEAVECCGVSLPVPLFGSRSFNERPLCARSGRSIGFIESKGDRQAVERSPSRYLYGDWNRRSKSCAPSMHSRPEPNVCPTAKSSR